MGTTIRPARPDDADILTTIALAGKRHWGYRDALIEAWRGLLTITPDYVTANIVACAVNETGQVVGFYSLERDGDGLWLENLFLVPALIGHGLGRQLFEHAVQTARALGVVEFLIESDPNAEGFYLRMGAQHIGEAVSRMTGVERVVPILRYVLPGGEPTTP
jgi:GNAT superfamily N-acetyltransferase